MLKSIPVFSIRNKYGAYIHTQKNVGLGAGFIPKTHTQNPKVLGMKPKPKPTKTKNAGYETQNPKCLGMKPKLKFGLGLGLIPKKIGFWV